MKVLIDSDVLRYEVGFGAVVGWKAITNSDSQPPFSYVADLLHERINLIMQACAADEYTLFITEGRTFRFDIATTKPYKGTRVGEKPWHYDNLTAYISSLENTKVVTYLEADDAIAIEHTANPLTTIIASRDKDLRTIPGMVYSWELGRQPSFGPETITREGYLKLSSNHKKLAGVGLSYFYAQLLMGDSVDNILGCRGVGPVAAFNLLNDKSPEEQLAAVINEYQKEYGIEWETVMTEMGQLLWLVRTLDNLGKPCLYQIGKIS